MRMFVALLLVVPAVSAQIKPKTQTHPSPAKGSLPKCEVQYILPHTFPELAHLSSFKSPPLPKTAKFPAPKIEQLSNGAPPTWVDYQVIGNGWCHFDKTKPVLLVTPDGKLSKVIVHNPNFASIRVTPK